MIRGPGNDTISKKNDGTEVDEALGLSPSSTVYIILTEEVRMIILYKLLNYKDSINCGVTQGLSTYAESQLWT